MNIYVLDESFNRQYIIDIYESFIWTDRYFESGDFEIYLPANKDVINKLQKDMYLMVDNSDFIKIIEDIEITTNLEEGNKLKITGRSLDSILDRRIIWGLTEVNGSLQDSIEELLNKNVINPEDPNRRIPNFIMKKSTDPDIVDLTIDAQYFGENLYDTIVALCKANFIGFKVTVNDNHQMEFELYKGAERTYNQTNYPTVEFSPRFDNLLNSEYIRSDKALKNVTLIGGEGEGAKRKTSSTYTTAGLGVLNLDIVPQGLKRRETFTDANSISSKVQDGDGNDVTLTDEEYTEKLNHKGMQELAEANGVTTFNGEVNSYVQSIYNRDYFLGDVVQIENEFEMKGVTRIIEVIFSDNTQDGVQLYPTFKSDDSESWSGTAVINGDFNVTETFYTEVLRNAGSTILHDRLVTYTKMDKINAMIPSKVTLNHSSDYIEWKYEEENKKYPITYGGVRWRGQGSVILLNATETGLNNTFQLNISLQNNVKSAIVIQNHSGVKKASVSSTGRAEFTSLYINDKEFIKF